MTFNVLQVTPELDTGGVERTSVEVAEALSAQGHGAFVFSAGGRLEAALAAAGGTLLRGPAASKDPRIVLWGNVRAIERIVRERRIDIIHARSRASAWSALIAARRTGTAFVTTYHGIYSGTNALKRSYNSVMARGDAVIANSVFTRDHLIATHATAPDRVHVIHRGVDIGAFDPAAVSQARREALRAAWGLADNPARPVVMLPGRLTEWKGQTVLVEAIAALRGQGLDTLALLVGDAQGRDEYAASIDSLAARLGVADLVRRVGHCADMPAAFTLCDVVATPSTQPEAFGRTAAEALAMGVPVIASNLGATPEIITGPDLGLLVASGDPAALAGAISALAHNATPQARAAMGAAGRARVAANFTKATLQEKTLRLYQEIVSNAAGAPSLEPRQETA